MVLDPLPQSFCAREVEALARTLLGCRLQRGEVVLRITEVEAYAGPEDTASHARAGETPRTAVMWGPAGRVYVYLCYGIHNMLNISAGEAGRASAVLIRACEPLAGLEQVRARRGGKTGPTLLDGPGKVGAALELDTSWSGHPLYEPGELVLAGPEPDWQNPGLLVGARVGIDFAAPEDRDRPWRFALADNPWVGHRKLLRAQK
ncbi:DNA-3-methyladenine glycosylase [Pseudenhygromyxa sp. WMMC2535]|uniref:DNA-3-methyladenine glycosylase n=1 Tax=Pseudenhygromyxa sp. WMMC2535 TaxID=2712867 RepID=UPI0015567C18|nr:DNA-3-methyladenine glycosylase [Pseudenhygromyxa sp. WMMC2535]NVB39981.1 DNA-3-methyladenine glycosylase [Pseudenhygromyxa sp. WMMC2535]